jgi:hypothetical protein
VGSFFRTKRSPVIGFLIAPLAPLLALIVLAILTNGRTPEFIWGAVLILPISYISALIVGTPSVYVLRKWGKVRLWQYVATGLVVSVIPIFVFLVYPFMISSDPSSPASGFLVVHYKIAAVMALSGALVAATFWIVTRPDKLPGRNT